MDNFDDDIGATMRQYKNKYRGYLIYKAKSDCFRNDKLRYSSYRQHKSSFESSLEEIDDDDGYNYLDKLNTPLDEKKKKTLIKRLKMIAAILNGDNDDIKSK